MKTFIAKVIFVLLLLLGVPSLALAHNGVTHVQPHMQATSIQEAIASVDHAQAISAEVKSVVMKTDVSAKVEKTANGTCPCGRDCGQCACFMSSCCQFINKTATLTIPVSVEGKGIFTHEILIIGMTGETLSKPPQNS